MVMKQPQPGPSGDDAGDKGRERGSQGTLSSQWLCAEGDSPDVVVSSRVRLARNLGGHLFVHKASPEQRRDALDMCRSWLLGAGLCERIVWVDLHEVPAIERTLLVERHLISKQLAKGRSGGGGAETAKPDARAVAYAVPDEHLSIMVNEEDHLRVQVIRSGLALREAWQQIDQIDDRIEAGLDYAFSPRLGYLTACPTNIGTGLRMSVMLHLPALKLTGEIEKVKRAAGDMNLAVRGFYGEGSEAIGDLYQVSNQTTLGKGERAILRELQDEILPQIIEYERSARKTLLTRRLTMLEDHVHRALGTLRHARLMAAEEAMTLLSHVRLGVVCGLVPQMSLRQLHELIVLVQPAHLQRFGGRELDQEQRRVARASLLRQKMNG